MDGVVEHVAHVQHPGDVGWGDHNGVGLSVIGHTSKGFGLFPGLGPAVLNGGGVVMGGDVLGHDVGVGFRCAAKFSLLKWR